MTRDKWMREARRYAEHVYCYAGMVAEFPDDFDRAFSAGEQPYDAVDAFGDRVGLERCDQFYGVNSGKEFVRLGSNGVTPGD